MTRKILNPLALVLLPLAAAAAGAGTLGPGVRDGSIVEPDGRSESVTFEVVEVSGQLEIVMTEEGGGRVSFDDVHFEDGDLVFSWKTGDASIHCVLAPAGEDAYAGSCNDLRLNMGPPNR